MKYISLFLVGNVAFRYCLGFGRKFVLENSVEKVAGDALLRHQWNYIASIVPYKLPVHFTYDYAGAAPLKTSHRGTEAEGARCLIAARFPYVFKFIETGRKGRLHQLQNRYIQGNRRSLTLLSRPSLRYYGVIVNLFGEGNG